MPPFGPSRSTEGSFPPPTTKPIEEPRKGLIVFEAHTKSMCSITKVDGAGFDVWVHNGGYSGRSEGSEFLINYQSMTRAGTSRQPGQFSEVVSLSAEEVRHWYLDSVKGVAELMKGHGQDKGAGRLEQLLQERNDELDIIERTIEFLKERGLAGDFADWLEQQPVTAREPEDDEVGLSMD